MELIDILYTIAIVLVVVGAINWGATAFGNNLVDLVAGKDSTFSKVVYYLVAAAGLAVVAGLLTKNIKVKKDE
jgi:uncharacterized membrane protein YuzA (DUF378 family)